MNTSLRLSLAVSLALNALLAVLLIVGRASAPTPAPATAAPAPRVAPAGPVVDGQTWASLQRDDLPGLVAHLRAAGFPPEVVRAILTAQIREQFAARERALDPGAETRPFWKSPAIDPKVQVARLQLQLEQQKILRALLGADADSQIEVSNLYRGRRMDSVPAEKRADVTAILRDFEMKSAAVYADGIFGPDQFKRMAALEGEQRAALAALLTPQELADYELRNSNSARAVRSSLAAFDPTEEEFRTVYRAQAEFDARFGRSYGIQTADEMRLRSEAQRQMNEQIKAALGPVRGAEYERAVDFSYRQTSQLVGRLELPAETTAQVWAVKKEIEDRRNALFRDAALPPAERTQRTAALVTEAETKLAPLLGGARGMEAYRQYGGSWLQTLQPRPAPPAPVPTR